MGEVRGALSLRTFAVTGGAADVGVYMRVPLHAQITGLYERRRKPVSYVRGCKMQNCSTEFRLRGGALQAPCGRNVGYYVPP